MSKCNYKYVISLPPKMCHTPSLKDKNMEKEKKGYLTLWSLHFSNAYLGSASVKRFGNGYLEKYIMEGKIIWQNCYMHRILFCKLE